MIINESTIGEIRVLAKTITETHTENNVLWSPLMSFCVRLTISTHI